MHKKLTSTGRIPIAGPWITPLEIDLVADAAANSWYDGSGKYYDLFEKEMAAYLGVKHAVSLSHCTSAIHLSLMALTVGGGDEVIVPDITWIASAAPVSYVGATPVFADVDPDTWCIDANSLEECITKKTKAIIVVDLYGGMPAMNSILDIANSNGIPIIEDSAEAIGSEFCGKKAGSFGKTGVFSFHGSKTLTTGEGGLLATDDSELFDRVLFLRDHGRLPGDVTFNNTEVAYKYKMSSMQAAMGYGQLQRINELVGKKRKIFSWYKDRLKSYPSLKLNAEPKDVKNSYWMSSILVSDSLSWPKLDLIRELAAKGIDSRPFFSPLSSIPAYRGMKQAQIAQNRNVTAYRISKQALNLPSALILSEDDVARVCDNLVGILGL